MLRDHPAVRSGAVVAARADDGGDMLVAYVVAERRRGRPRTCATSSASTLPDYMVPAQFVRIDALPLTANGKLDRAALPDPSESNALASEPGSPRRRRRPSERLAEIVVEVLGRGQVGVDDNFFLLGGHSLLGTQVVLRAGEAFGVELTLRHLFEAPTVRTARRADRGAGDRDARSDERRRSAAPARRE